MEKLYKKIGWKNKPNLSTPLGATNLGKIDEALDGLDNRTIEMSESIATNRRNIELLYPRVEKNESAIETLTKKSNDIDALKIVSTASGSPAYMEDASNMGLEGIDFFGESKQETTTGKNELDCSGLTEQTISGVTFTPVYENGLLQYVNVNGTCTASSTSQYVLKQALSLNDNEQHTLNGCHSGGSGTFKLDCFYTGSGSFDDTGKGVTFTARKGESLRFRIVVFAGATLNNVKFYPMLRKASVTDATYEPYTGGKASPSPDYPQPIESKLVSYVVVHGTNFINQTCVAVYPDMPRWFLKKGVYTASRDSIESGYNWYIGAGDENRNIITEEALEISGYTMNSTKEYYYGGISNDSVTFTVKKDCYLKIGSLNGSGKTYLMLNKGNVALPYEPYQSQTAYLSGLIALNGIGDVKDTDKLQKFGVVVLNGTETWYKHDDNYPHLFKTSITPYANGNVPLLCSHFPYDSGDLLGGKDGCRFRLASSADVFYISSSKHTDVSAFKSWLASNPITVVYELAEPIETALPQADIDAIKALHSYKPNTVVMNNGNAEMDVHYVADAKTYIDNKFKELANAIVNQ